MARVQSYKLWLVFHAILFLLLNLIFHKSMFSAGESDGFFIGVQASRFFSVEGMESLLELVHLVRFAIALPFLWVWEGGHPAILESALMLAYMWPVVTARLNRRIPFAQALYLYLPYVLSFRTVLVACAIAYLFILVFSEKRNAWLLCASAVLANLSSGVVVGWLLIAIINYKTLRAKHALISLLVPAMGLSLAFSLAQKVDFFSQTARETRSDNGFIEALTRNTFVVSYQNQQYARLAVYVIMVFLILLILGQALLSFHAGLRASLFYACAVPGFFLEGLSVMAFIFPVAWFFLGIRPLEHEGSDPPQAREFLRV